MSSTLTPPRKVLVIEDNPDGRESMRMVLELLGFQVEVAPDGPAGVNKALTWRPRFAVVDIGLPGCDGYEVARRVKAALDGGVFLVALTGYGQPADRDRALASGFDSFMTKPADFDVLTRLLKAPGPDNSGPAR